MHLVRGDITIKDRCEIGADAMVLPHVVFGQNSIATVGNVVKKHVLRKLVKPGLRQRSRACDKDQIQNRCYLVNKKCLNRHSDLQDFAAARQESFPCSLAYWSH
jgi:serine acetyltransferase